MRAMRVLGIGVVVAASVAYCLPLHTSFKQMKVMDAVLHIGFFLALAATLVAWFHRPSMPS